MNRTDVADENTEDRYGFGLAAYRVMLKEKKVNFIFGMEYNQTRQKKERIAESHFSHSRGVEYTFHSLSFPLSFRYSIGENVNYFKMLGGLRFFVQAGGFIDITPYSKMEGTRFTYLPRQDNSIDRTQSHFSENAKIKGFTYGLLGGFGFRVPLEKKELICSLEYRLGLLELSSSENIYNRYIRLNIGLGF